MPSQGFDLTLLLGAALFVSGTSGLATAVTGILILRCLREISSPLNMISHLMASPPVLLSSASDVRLGALEQKFLRDRAAMEMEDLPDLGAADPAREVQR